MREIVGAIFDVLRAEFARRMLAKDFSAMTTVSGWFLRFRLSEIIDHHLVMRARERVGREVSRSAAVFGSGASRGWRWVVSGGNTPASASATSWPHTGGRALIIQARSANVQDRGRRNSAAQGFEKFLPVIELTFTDSGYDAQMSGTPPPSRSLGRPPTRP